MHIAILTGGISSERSIALRSGANIHEWIRISGYTGDLYDFPNQLQDFLAKYQTYDLFIPMFHGIYGEDGQVTAFLKTLGCHYAYSDFAIHTLCIDKYLTNLCIEKIEVKIPETICIPEGSSCKCDNLTYPRFIKPNKGGSSISNFLVKNAKECEHALDSIKGDDILIQSLIHGQEFTVGAYRDDTGIHILPIIEIITLEGEFFNYTEKYATNGSNEVFAIMEDELRENLEETSKKIYEHIGCRGVVRMDYLYDGTHLYFLEVNTIPGFTSGSLVPKMWKKAGKTEKDFIDMIFI